MRDLQIVDLSKWTRRAEVEDYAERRGIKISEAIRELVNQGLTHQVT